MERPTFDYEKRTWSPLLLLPGALVYLDGGPCLAVYVAGAKPARATIRQQQLDEVRAARRSA